MLALADRNGLIDAALPGLSNAARVSLEDCEKAVSKFLAPDPYSRTTDHEGRRIEKVEGGWRLLNHAAYRAKLSKEDRLDYQRVKQSEYRAKKRGRSQRSVQKDSAARERRYLKAKDDGDDNLADKIAAGEA